MALQVLSATNEQTIIEFKQTLQGMPTDMRLFSLTMRSLYADKAVGTKAEASQKFRKLRDETRDDAMVYLKVILPLSTKFVSSISEYFEYYEALKFDEWCEAISDILEETVCYRQITEAVLQMHEDFLVPLKKREDQAKIIITEFRDLQTKFEKMKGELEGKAGTKRTWAIVLAFIPVVNLIACPLLSVSAQSDFAEAVAKGEESKIHEAAALAVSTALIPALSAFIEGIRKAAALFSVMENDLRRFEGKAKRGTESPKQAYFSLMKNQAKDMKSICQSFYAALPDVRTDFRAIPEEGTDQNYVDRWLGKQKKIIKEKVNVTRVLSEMLHALTSRDADSTN